MSSLVSTRNCKLGHDCRRVCSHRRRDATRQFRRVGVGGVYWALAHPIKRSLLFHYPHHRPTFLNVHLRLFFCYIRELVSLANNQWQKVLAIVHRLSLTASQRREYCSRRRRNLIYSIHFAGRDELVYALELRNTAMAMDYHRSYESGTSPWNAKTV